MSDCAAALELRVRKELQQVNQSIVKERKVMDATESKYMQEVYDQSHTEGKLVAIKKYAGHL